MYPNLRRAMHDKGISIEAVSALICVHRNTVSNRLNCNSSFLAEEALQIKEELFPEYDFKYLFSK